MTERGSHKRLVGFYGTSRFRIPVPGIIHREAGLSERAVPRCINTYPAASDLNPAGQGICNRLLNSLFSDVRGVLKVRVVPRKCDRCIYDTQIQFPEPLREEVVLGSARAFIFNENLFG